jgi:hypothetical protein
MKCEIAEVVDWRMRLIQFNLTGDLIPEMKPAPAVLVGTFVENEPLDNGCDKPVRNGLIQDQICPRNVGNCWRATPLKGSPDHLFSDLR